MKKVFHLINITEPVVPILPERFKLIHLNKRLLKNELYEQKTTKSISFLLKIKRVFCAYIKILIFIFRHQDKNYLILTQPPLLKYFILFFFPNVAKKSTILLMDLYPQLFFHRIIKKLKIEILCNKILLKPLLVFKKIVFIANGRSFKFALKNKKSQNVFLARNCTSLKPLKKILKKNLSSIKILYQGSLNATVDARYMNKFEEIICKQNIILTRNIKTGFFHNKKSNQDYVSDKKLVDIMKNNHFGLIILKESISDYTNPSKFISFLSQGVPILYFGPIDNEIYQIITKEHCGIILPKKMDTLARILQSDRLKNYHFYSTLQRNALKSYKKYYSSEAIKMSWKKII